MQVFNFCVLSIRPFLQEDEMYWSDTLCVGVRYYIKGIGKGNLRHKTSYHE